MPWDCLQRVKGAPSGADEPPAPQVCSGGKGRVLRWVPAPCPSVAAPRKTPLPWRPGDGLGNISSEGCEVTAKEISGNSMALPEGARWAERGMSSPGAERGCHSCAPGRPAPCSARPTCLAAEPGKGLKARGG